MVRTLPLGPASENTMASLYSNDKEDMLPYSYFVNQPLASYSSSGNAYNNSKVHESQPSLLSYQNSMCRDQYSIGISIDETVFIPPTSSVSTVMQQINMQLNNTPRNSDSSVVISDNRVLDNESMHAKSSQHFPQYHTLSLSLGSQEPSMDQLHSDLRNSNLCLLSSSNMHSEVEFSQNDLNNVQYGCFEMAGKSRATVQFGATSEFQNLVSSEDTCFVPSIQQEQIYIGRLWNSPYLNATQDLLDELVNVHRAPNKQMETVQGLGQIGYLGVGVTKDGASAELQESNVNNGCRDLSPSECQDLRNKHMKLLGMLDEVVRRFKQYEHQMQAVVTSFEMVARRGAALPYVSAPLQTISRRFRCVRDAIKKQIQATQKSLEEHDVHSNGVGVLSRLRYVDQKLREQKALKQFGVVRQPWRPQRGLPETAVSLLRAWLFEHFLHPYPTESEKMVLARETGLTRSQVANWFINARVRLWKPMIEEIYKEEFGDAQTESRPVPAHGTTSQEISAAYAFFSDNNALPNKTADENVVCTSTNQVSLVLGLQHTMKDSSKHIVDEIQSKGNDDSSSSMVLDKLECYYKGLPNNHNMFSNTYLLSDFVT